MQINFLYHLTHIRNLENILAFGLLSRNDLSFGFIEFENIADPEVLSRGENKNVFDKNLFDFVRLYFNPRNPMLYRIKKIQDEILILCVDKKILLEKDTVFSDGNAPSAPTKFYKELENLKKIDWKVLNSRFWNKFEDGKRKACAEALIYSKVPVTSIKKILCNNVNIRNNVIELINNKQEIIVEINKYYYF